MGVSTVSLIIVLFLLIMVLAMQFQIRQISRKMDELLKRKR
jgi:regulatory protein YycI of two-component signal transduction system YycFG